MGVYVWNDIFDRNSLPICTDEQALQIIEGSISSSRYKTVEIDLDKANYFADNTRIKSEKIKKVILSLRKKKTIDKFISLQNLAERKDFVYQVITLLNDEVSSTIQIIQSDRGLLHSLKNSRKPQAVLEMVINKYIDRYVPSGSPILKSEINSISFKFSNPAETITISNFSIVSSIMDVLRMNYDFEGLIEFNLERDTLFFKKKIARDLFCFFYTSKEVLGTRKKSKVYRDIKTLFELADVDVTVDAIKEWVSSQN